MTKNKIEYFRKNNNLYIETKLNIIDTIGDINLLKLTGNKIDLKKFEYFNKNKNQCNYKEYNEGYKN
jgi:hypothetical protein